MEKIDRRLGVRRRLLLLRNFPQRPQQLVNPTAMLTDPHKPTQSTGGQESHPLTPFLALHQHLCFPIATALTGTPSPLLLLPSLLSPAQIPLPSPHLFPPLSIAPAPFTETGSSTQASHPQATSTHCSTPTSHTWGGNLAGMEEEELRCTGALDRRRSTAGASPR